MYKISVPVMNDHVSKDTRDRVLAELKRFGAERVFLALNTYEMDSKKRARVCPCLRLSRQCLCQYTDNRSAVRS